MSPSRGKSRRRGTKPPPTIVARPEEPPDPRRGWTAFLGKPVWQGIGALVAVAALVVATLEFSGNLRERTTISPTPADQTSPAPAAPGGTVICGLGGAGHQDSRVRCDLGAPGPRRSAGAGQDSRALAAGPVGPLPAFEPGTPASPRPASKRPGTTRPKATQPGTSRPTTAAPVPTTHNPAPPLPPPAGIVTTGWPTFVAVQRGGGATEVATQGAADFQVEAQHVSPLHGTEIERTAGACRYSPAYTDHGVGFEPADGARFCVRTRLGEMVVLEVVPSDTADTRPYPYTLRVDLA
jgi:hypothetical protein